MRSFLTAVAFLTVIPIPFREAPSTAGIARSRFWFPVVGLLLGMILGGWSALLAQVGLPGIAAFLVLLLWVGLTGALHLDGFCDLCDGLFAGRTPEDRLRIMKDPHLGTFGLAGGVLLLLGKFAALQVVVAAPARSVWVVAAAVTWARCLALCIAANAPYPRAEGTGKALIEATAWQEAGLISLAMAMLLSFSAPSAWWVAPALLLAGLVMIVALRWLCVARLGGVTGDCLGAGIEAAELLFLMGAALLM
jgi:adenosylcobinamide-GDP ribazoletransferase